eukprot:6550278-Prymnesium_polylepis.1
MSATDLQRPAPWATPLALKPATKPLAPLTPLAASLLQSTTAPVQATLDHGQPANGGMRGAAGRSAPEAASALVPHSPPPPPSLVSSAQSAETATEGTRVVHHVQVRHATAAHSRANLLSRAAAEPCWVPSDVPSCASPPQATVLSAACAPVHATALSPELAPLDADAPPAAFGATFTSLDGLRTSSEALLPASSRAAKESLATGVRFMDYRSGT